ncbi:MAG: type II secretion system protein [Phycisphaerales bacterium]
MLRTRHVHRRAFTLIELIAVMVVLAILSGVALPKFFDYSAQAKVSATKGALGGVRAAVANFYANSAITGTPAYPTYSQLTTVGTVLQEPIPENPYNGSPDVRDADGTYDAADPPVSGSEGWAYDATAGKFWPNTDNVGENEW